MEQQRPLVAMATKRLMAVAERPIDESQLDETCDLPQSVAIHMLQVPVFHVPAHLERVQ